MARQGGSKAVGSRESVTEAVRTYKRRPTISVLTSSKEMAICIYCKRDSGGSRGIPHVLPQVLAQNPLTLPIGTECDACNEYAGKKLEINLARYPTIAVAIQFLGTPGKRGKPRQELGGVHRQRVDAEHVQVNLRVRGQLSTGPDGKRHLEGHVPPVADFNFLGFRRALHHAGLNYVAAANGPTVALDQKYDPVRRYVKDPRPASESWPYGQVNKNEIPRLLAVGFIEYEDAEFVWIHIFQTIFVVDLLNSGALADVTRALGGTFVPSDAETPPPAVLTVMGSPGS